MFNAKDAIKLLKKTWNDPSELAQEIYALATSSKPIQVEVPLSIVGVKGKTALKITLPTPRPAILTTPNPVRPAGSGSAFLGPPQPPKFIINPGPGIPPGPQPLDKPRAATQETRTDVPRHRVLPAPARAGDSLNPPPLRSRPAPEPRPQSSQGVGTPRQAEYESSLPVTSRPAFVQDKPPQESATTAPRPIFKVPFRSGDPVPVKLAPFSPSKPHEAKAEWTTPYANPVVDISGPVALRGQDPVQFDAVPTILNKRTGNYDPIADYDLETGTHVPWGKDVYGVWMGKVKSGSGTKWVVTIYPNGQPPPSGDTSNPTNIVDVNVTLLGTGPNHNLNVGDWVGPIMEVTPEIVSDHNLFYLFPPSEGRIGKAGASGVPARSGSTPGHDSGGILYTWTGTGAATVDVTVDFYNWSSVAVAASAFIQVKRIEGRWFVDVEDC